MINLDLRDLLLACRMVDRYADDLALKMTYAAGRNIDKLTSIFKVAEKKLQPGEKDKEYDRQLGELQHKYAQRNEKGNVIITENGTPLITSVEYDVAAKALESENTVLLAMRKGAQAEYEEWLQAEAEPLELHKCDAKYLRPLDRADDQPPKRLPPSIIAKLLPMLLGEIGDEPEPKKK